MAYQRRPNQRRPQRYYRRAKVCQFCVDKIHDLDYKQTDIIRRFTTEQGKIRPRRQTGTCSRHQRMLSNAVKRARHMALLPFSGQVYS